MPRSPFLTYSICRDKIIRKLDLGQHLHKHVLVGEPGGMSGHSRCAAMRETLDKMLLNGELTLQNDHTYRLSFPTEKAEWLRLQDKHTVWWASRGMGLLVTLNLLVVIALSYCLWDRTSDLLHTQTALEVCQELVSAP